MSVSHVSQAQDALPTAVGVTFLTFLTSMPPEVILGSFAGSVIFLLGAANKPKWQWLLYFIVAFIAGLLGAKPIADVIGGLLGLAHIPLSVPQGLGALFSAACTINVVAWFRDNPAYLWTRKQGGEA